MVKRTSLEGYFAVDYRAARAGFLSACRAAGAAVESHKNPTRGPDGEALFADLAWLGPPTADRVLVTLSATHGVEGFCGSGVQVGWLKSGLYKELPAGVALLQIHAINPHGFAWLRRVTEDNVDLNRNFIEHDKPYPRNKGYEELADIICPRDWTDAVIAKTSRELNAYAEEHGIHALQRAMTGGQYSHPDGIFFGGHAVTWSRQSLNAILRSRLPHARRVAVIDYHTGLGPYGYGERICVHPPGSDGLAQARAWYDGDVTSPYLGTSSSAELCGVNVIGMQEALPHAELTAIALEYGTLPMSEVSLALRADNWVHIYGDLSSAKGRAIKSQIREAFYADKRDWKQSVWDRAVETQRQALKGLAAG